MTPCCGPEFKSRRAENGALQLNTALLPFQQHVFVVDLRRLVHDRMAFDAENNNVVVVSPFTEGRMIKRHGSWPTEGGRDYVRHLSEVHVNIVGEEEVGAARVLAVAARLAPQSPLRVRTQRDPASWSPYHFFLTHPTRDTVGNGP